MKQKNVNKWFGQFLDAWEGQVIDGEAMTFRRMAELLHVHRDTLVNYATGVTTADTDTLAIALINLPGPMVADLFSRLKEIADLTPSAGDDAAALLRKVTAGGKVHAEYLHHMVEAAVDGRYDEAERMAALRLIAQQRAALDEQERAIKGADAKLRFRAG